jgi:GTPase SAR1 family protein
VRLILVTGPPGSGKTSVLTTLADSLSDDDVPHAALEVEALAWTHPPLPGERRLANVRALCAGHDLGGADLVLSTEGARAEDIAARIRETARL